MSTRLGGRYELIREIGSGGMGRVYQAADADTGRTVAVKVLLPSSAQDLSTLLRFQQEGAVLSSLGHPNIVQVYGTFLDVEEQTNCIVMEFLEGEPLTALLRRSPLPLRRVKRIALQVASALAYAHTRGIVHRDVKPDNIVVSGDDHVKVTDFGIARVLHPGVSLNTSTGTTIGTPLYMSPEQIEGTKVDGRSDIYSLGAVLYEMVTSRPPFDGDDPITVAFKHVHKQPAPLRSLNPELPPAWENLIIRMLAKRPDNRFPTAAMVEEALATLPDDYSDAPTVRHGARPRQYDTVVAPLLPRDQSIEEASGEDAARPPSSTTTEPEKRAGTRNVRLIAGAVSITVLAILVGAGFYLLHPHAGAPTRSGALPLALQPSTVFAAALNDPESIAVDRQGTVFSADSGNNRVTILAPPGKEGTSVGTTRFAGPTGLAIDRSGNLYVADSRNGRIVKLSPAGAFLASWGKPGTGRGQFEGVHSVAVDSHGFIYAADYGNNRIQKLSPGGRVVQIWGGLASSHAPGQFNHPVGVTVDTHDNVYVADFDENRVQKLSSSGHPLKLIGLSGPSGTVFAGPHGVAVDRNGVIYVAQYSTGTVGVYSATGTSLAQIRHWGPNKKLFGRPTDVALDGKGRLYVTDARTNTVATFVATK